jgi:hypothetical protein
VIIVATCGVSILGERKGNQPGHTRLAQIFGSQRGTADMHVPLLIFNSRWTSCGISGRVLLWTGRHGIPSALPWFPVISTKMTALPHSRSWLHQQRRIRGRRELRPGRKSEQHVKGPLREMPVPHTITHDTEGSGLPVINDVRRRSHLRPHRTAHMNLQKGRIDA